MTARRSTLDRASPAAALDEIARLALEVTKKARQHRKALSGDNFYGNKLANLRLDAAAAFEEIYEQSTGDAAAIAELIEVIFGTSTSRDDRLKAYRELSFSLRKVGRKAPSTLEAESGEGSFQRQFSHKLSADIFLRSAVR